MSHAQNTNSALALFSDPKLKPAGDALSRLQEQSISDLNEILTSEKRTSATALRLGVRLNAVKIGLGHGIFGSWLDANFNGVSGRTVRYYMKLAVVAAPKLGRKALVAIVSGQEDQDTAARIDRFVGDCSLTELLIKHNIRSVGLRGELQAGDEQQLPPEKQLELAIDRTWTETLQSVERMRSVLTEPDKVRLLSDPTKVATLKEQVVELNRLLDERLQSLRAVAV